VVCWLSAHAESPRHWDTRLNTIGGLNVFVVRHGKKDDATHRLTLSAMEVRQLYRVHAYIVV
jgi:hypothetical protein